MEDFILLNGYNQNMIIHSTQKLAKKLPIVSKEILSDNNPLGSWHVNLYVIARRNCVMFCHDKIRFCLFIPALKKAELENLDFWFRDAFANTMLKLNYDARIIEKALSFVTPLEFDTNSDRSVQGTMRVAHDDLHAILINGPNLTDLRDAPAYSISAQLNERPVTTKGMKDNDYLWPARDMKEFIEDL